MKTWFISDLHLDASRPHLLKLCLEFLNEIQHQVDALYILGDLFEYWLGDDSLQSPELEIFLPILSKLKALSDNGVPLYFIAGNRDFLISTDFERKTGCQILEDEVVIDLYGVPTLIMHGDTLCTDDISYLQLRELLRSKQWQKDFLALSIKERIEQALKLRNASKEQTANKSEEILDVNQQAVELIMHKHDVLQLIHGHTHRMATHEFNLNGREAKRIVLGDWYKHSHFLSVDQNSYTLV